MTSLLIIIIIVDVYKQTNHCTGRIYSRSNYSALHRFLGSAPQGRYRVEDLLLPGQLVRHVSLHLRPPLLYDRRSCWESLGRDPPSPPGRQAEDPGAPLYEISLASNRQCLRFINAVLFE